MSHLRDTLVSTLCEAYSAYYDVTPVSDGTSLQARCTFHARNSQYVLVKRAEIWAAETHDYLNLHSVAKLDIATADAIMARTVTECEPLVKPHSQHISTGLSAVVLCDSISPDALAHIKKMKKRRDYKLSLHGWMEFKIAVVDVSTGEIFTNHPGRQLAADVDSLVKKNLKNRKGEE